jgi:endonuclease YncB( thermonuclease family)
VGGGNGVAGESIPEALETASTVPGGARSRTFRSAVCVAVLLVAVGCARESVPGGPVEHARVATVSDGDTLRLTDGRRIRLVQIDAPERGVECFGDRARAALLRLAPPGTRVELEGDPALDDRDRFGRLLRTVRVRGRSVNLALVAQGAAAPYFYRGARGRGAGALLEAAERARSERRGLWGSCLGVRLLPTRALDSGRS